MIARIKSFLEQARVLKTDAEARQVAIALMRITLQHACIALSEWLVKTRLGANNLTVNQRPLPLNELRTSSDGTLVAILAELLVAAENEGWNGASRPFWQPILPTRPCVRLSTNRNPNIEGVLQGFVSLRNDGVEGHGIPGNYDRDAELDAVELILDTLSHILPFIGPGNELILNVPSGQNYQLQLLRTYSGDLICYRKIQKLSGGRCLIKAQRQISLFTREDVSYEANDILGSAEASNGHPVYRITATYDEEWSPLVVVPDRLTDQFTGRDEALEELSDWIDDIESRACMLFGDGGIGKTTLAVEFLHRWLSGEIKVKWRPQLITFYTAKQTRWGLNGLEILRGRPVGVLDAVTDIVRSFENAPLEREWFDRDPAVLIQKLSNYLKDWGIDRSSHLLILDNTETMITNDDEIRLLVKHIRELSRRVGRILLTSRRREAVEARQIEIKPFNAEESLRFLRVRAETLNRQQILQAGVPKLRQFADRLGNKPLVLEVFIHALGEPNISLDRAFDRVLRMQRQDLGEFLYDDAWKRMSENMKHLLLLMVRVADIHDDLLLKLCCLQVGVSIIEASEALEESRGIASISRIEDRLQIAFSPDFLKYCENRTIIIGDTEYPTISSVELVRRRYNEFLKSATAKVYDRVSRAYRHPLARAAWAAYQQGRFEDCELFYEEAVLADADNGWLFDRYAYFLFSQQRLVEAYNKAITATRLIGNDPEAWFTRGMIEARLRETKSALSSLNRAVALGKPVHLCLLQQAYAYVNDIPPDKARARAALEESERKISPNDHYRWKHMSEIRQLRTRLDYI